MLKKLSTFENPVLDRQIEEIVYVVNTERATPDSVTDAITTAITAHEAEVNPHPTYLTQAEGDGFYPAETTTTVGSLITAATSKATPVDADSIALSDSAAGNILKKLLWSNLKATLKTYFDTIYTTATAVVTYVAGINYGRQFGYSHEDHSVTGTLTETELWNTTIPGGTLGINSVVRITTLWTWTNSANNKTLRVKFGGTSVLSQTVSNSASIQVQSIIRNRGDLAVQLASFNGIVIYGISAGAPIALTVDTAADVVISITGQLFNTGETITLKDVFIEVLK